MFILNVSDKLLKLLIYIFIIIPIPFVFANDTNILRHRLTKIHSFYANFTQNIINVEGSIIQKNQGKIWIRTPNYLKLKMISPDENILISDGKTLWFYNPFVEQITASWLKDIINNTPFLLIIYNRNSDWQKFNVKKLGDHFLLVPKFNSGVFNKAIINITANGIIKAFSTFESNGLCNTYLFHQHKQTSVNIAEFQLKLPSGVTLDDQRN